MQSIAERAVDPMPPETYRESPPRRDEDALLAECVGVQGYMK
jgi:hypothetical protein